MAALSPLLINIGVSPNDGGGDPLREAFDKVNQNVSAIYNRGVPGSELSILGGEILSLETNGNITVSPDGTGSLVVNSDRLVMAESYTPASSVGVFGDVFGSFAFDANYMYVCVANFDGISDIWRRVALSATPF